MPVPRGHALLLALLLSACGPEVTIERSSEVDGTAAPGSTSGDPAGPSGAGESGPTGGAGGGGAPEPPLEWPSGPADDPPEESACAWSPEVGTDASAFDDARSSELVRRLDGSFRYVGVGTKDLGDDTRRGFLQIATQSFRWDDAVWQSSGTYQDEALSAAGDDLLPFAARGDATVHVVEGDDEQLRVRELVWDDDQQRLMSVTNRYHDLPGITGIQAVAVLGATSTLVAHGPREAPLLSHVSFRQEAPYPPPSIAALAEPKACADRPVALRFAPWGDVTLFAASTDGTRCDGARGAPASVIVGTLDENGTVSSSDVVDVGAPVEELWVTASEAGAWLAIRTTRGPRLLLGRIGDDARIEPVAQLDAATNPSLAAWRDGLAVVDVTDDGAPRVRLVDGEGRVVDRLPALPEVRRAHGRSGVLASPDGDVLALAVHDDEVPTLGDHTAMRTLLLRADCDL